MIMDATTQIIEAHDLQRNFNGVKAVAGASFDLR
jgi:hypothetical protein